MCRDVSHLVLHSLGPAPDTALIDSASLHYRGSRLLAGKWMNRHIRARFDVVYVRSGNWCYDLRIE